MLTPPARDDALVAVAAGVLGVAGNLALVGLSPDAFARVDAAVVAATPGPVVAVAIQTFGSAGHVLHLALAFAITAGAFGAVALAGLAVARRGGASSAGVTATAGVVGALAFAVTGSPLAAIGSGIGAAVPVALALVRTGGTGGTVDMDRRRVVEFVASVGILAAAASAVGFLRTPEDASAVGGQTPMEMLDTAAAASFDVDGLGGLVSTRDAHYEVDINAIDPRRNADEHTVTVTGAIDAPVEFTMADLRALPTEHRYTTLRCVGESLNGTKIDTAVWTGTPVDAVLDAVTPNSGCECVMLHGADGYHVQFPVAALRGGLLAYGMNGRELPRGHGFPVRALVPGHWGETNAKWLTEIEFLDEAVDGYWEKRGWHGTGPVETVAKLHAIERHDDGRVTVAGPAYAGTRGIDRVEVSTDGGATWTDAELTDPLPGDDVWRHWKLPLEIDAPTDVTVRAIDGTGRLQPETERRSFPRGPSGWVTEEVKP